MDKVPLKYGLWIFLLILVAVVMSYANVLNGEFMFDDDRVISENPLVKDPSGLFRLGLQNHFMPGQRTFTTLTLAFNYALGGKNVFGYHLFNIVIHLVMVVVVYLFVRRLLCLPSLRNSFSNPELMALLTALVYALHPIQTEAVSYIAQRSEALSSLFYMLALSALIRYTEKQGKQAAVFYGLGIAAFALGWLNKEVVVTVPFVFLLYSFYFGEMQDRKRALYGILPIIAAGLVLGLYAVTALKGSGEAGFDIPGLGQPEYFYTGLSVLLRYLQLIVLPIGLTLDHDVKILRDFGQPAVAGALLLWTALMVLSVLTLRSKGRWSAHIRLMGFGILWYLVILAPSSLIVPLKDVMYEHRVYLALLGIILAGIALVDMILCYAGEKFGVRPARFFVGLLLILGISLSYATFQRNKVWQTKVALWSDAVAKAPYKPRPHYNLGGSYYLLKNYPAALREYLIAEKLGHEDIRLYYNLAITFGQLGYRNEANAYYRKYMSLQR